ncbi:hypothetical protein K438DRAFT_1783810 [Mycena galopus ATCC 62051]|nr:hypothetical protein K438DRAFT_1783810 [Mycena galopus ATCC 62051]
MQSSLCIWRQEEQFRVSTSQPSVAWHDWKGDREDKETWFLEDNGISSGYHRISHQWRGVMGLSGPASGPEAGMSTQRAMATDHTEHSNLPAHSVSGREKGEQRDKSCDTVESRDQLQCVMGREMSRAETLLSEAKKMPGNRRISHQWRGVMGGEIATVRKHCRETWNCSVPGIIQFHAKILTNIDTYTDPLHLVRALGDILHDFPKGLSGFEKRIGGRKYF